MKKENGSGFTLVEILVAISLASVIMILASKIFLAGHSQSVLRSRESGLLREGLLLQWQVERNLQTGDAEDSIPPGLQTAALKQHYPHLTSIGFSEFDLDSISGNPVAVQPGETGSLWTWKAFFSDGTVQKEWDGSITR